MSKRAIFLSLRAFPSQQSRARRQLKGRAPWFFQKRFVRSRRNSMGSKTLKRDYGNARSIFWWILKWRNYLWKKRCFGKRFGATCSKTVFSRSKLRCLSLCQAELKQNHSQRITIPLIKISIFASLSSFPWNVSWLLGLRKCLRSEEFSEMKGSTQSICRITPRWSVTQHTLITTIWWRLLRKCLSRLFRQWRVALQPNWTDRKSIGTASGRRSIILMCSKKKREFILPMRLTMTLWRKQKNWN